MADLPPDIVRMIIAYLSKDERSAPREIATWFRANIADPKSQDNTAQFKASHVSARVLDAAAALGAIPFLEWAQARHYPMGENVANEAALAGKLDVLIWAAKNHCLINLEQCAYNAILNDHLEVLKWLHQKRGYVLQAHSMSDAATCGHLKVMQWLNEHKIPLKKVHFTLTVAHGHLPVMEWLHEQGCPWDAESCFIAAHNKRVEVLRWLRERGCPWDEQTCTEAVMRGHVPSLEWAIKNGAPYNRQELLSIAPDQEVTRWLEKNTFALEVQPAADVPKRELTQEESAIFKQRSEEQKINLAKWTTDLQKRLSAEDLQHLVTHLPESVRAALPPTSDSYYFSTLMTELARYGSVQTLQWMNECNFPPPKNWRICPPAAGAGNLEALKWARKHDYPWDDTAIAAAHNGRLEVLQWAIANGCPWHEQVCYAAAQQGHFHLLIWALEKGAPYDPDKLIKSMANYPTMLATLPVQAAKLGHIPLLDRLAQHPLFKRSAKICESAASGGQLEALKWARSQGCPWGQKTLLEAAEAGHWDLVKGAHKIGCPFGQLDHHLYTLAVEQHRQDILNWLYDHDCSNKDNTILANAANQGDMETVQWLHDRGFPSSPLTCSKAAKGGHLKLLQWLHDNSYQWTETTCSGAAHKGHLDVLQWAHQEGCPWDVSVFTFAAMGGDFKTLRWLKEQGAPYNLEHILTNPSVKPEVKEWLRQNLSPPKISD